MISIGNESSVHSHSSYHDIYDAFVANPQPGENHDSYRRFRHRRTSHRSRPAAGGGKPCRYLANQVLHLQEDEASRPGDRRPLPARLEGNGQATRHRVLLRRRLDEWHDQGVRASGSLSCRPWDGRRTGRLPGEVPAGRHSQGMRRGCQERNSLGAAECRQARH